MLIIFLQGSYFFFLITSCMVLLVFWIYETSERITIVSWDWFMQYCQMHLDGKDTFVYFNFCVSSCCLTCKPRRENIQTRTVSLFKVWVPKYGDTCGTNFSICLNFFSCLSIHRWDFCETKPKQRHLSYRQSINYNKRF